MAKKDLNIAPDTALDTAPDVAFVATPQNTPVPGGGRYRWSDTAPHWIEIDEVGQPMVNTPAPTPVTLGA